MFRYYIRDNKTGKYIPEPTGVSRRGGSFKEPEHSDRARTFMTKLSAKRFLTAWLKGKHMSGDDGEGYSYVEAIQPVFTRIKEDMEIIEVEIKLP